MKVREASVLAIKAATLLTQLLFIIATNLPVRQVYSEPTIEVTKFHVPNKVQLGKSTRLICLYQLKGVTLHAMKLFKDNNEFYRYSPPNRELQRDEMKLTFPIPGVQVDERRSNATSVVLGPLTKQSAGIYKCQVSIEDTFKSVSAERRMELIHSSSPNPGGDFTATSGSSLSQNSNNNQARASATNPHQLQPSSFFNLQEPKSLIQPATNTKSAHRPNQNNLNYNEYQIGSSGNSSNRNEIILMTIINYIIFQRIIMIMSLVS